MHKFASAKSKTEITIENTDKRTIGAEIPIHISEATAKAAVIAKIEPKIKENIPTA